MLRFTCTAIGLFLMLSPASSAQLSKEDVSKIAATYQEAFSKKDPDGIAALYTKDGVHVNQTGIRNVAEYYGESFKAGMDKLDVTIDQVNPLTDNTGIAIGEFTVSGKNDKGEPIKASGRWADTLVNEGGVWKIRMLTAFPHPEKN